MFYKTGVITDGSFTANKDVGYILELVTRAKLYTVNPKTKTSVTTDRRRHLIPMTTDIMQMIQRLTYHVII